MLGMSPQQLVSNPSQSRQQAGVESVSAHADGWSMLLQAGQDYVEQVRGAQLFRRFSDGDRMIQQFPSAEIAMTRAMIPAHPQPPGCCGGPTQDLPCRCVAKRCIQVQMCQADSNGAAKKNARGNES